MLMYFKIDYDKVNDIGKSMKVKSEELKVKNHQLRVERYEKETVYSILITSHLLISSPSHLMYA